MLSMFASTPWPQFNPLSLMNANKGVVGVNVGHMWDENGPHDGVARSADEHMGSRAR
jgi:hypothetical protein